MLSPRRVVTRSCKLRKFWQGEACFRFLGCFSWPPPVLEIGRLLFIESTFDRRRDASMASALKRRHMDGFLIKSSRFSLGTFKLRANHCVCSLVCLIYLLILHMRRKRTVSSSQLLLWYYTRIMTQSCGTVPHAPPLAQAEVRRMVKNSPNILTVSIAENVRPKLAWLRERMGLDTDGVRKLVRRNSRVLSLKVRTGGSAGVCLCLGCVPFVSLSTYLSISLYIYIFPPPAPHPLSLKLSCSMYWVTGFNCIYLSLCVCLPFWVSTAFRARSSSPARPGLRLSLVINFPPESFHLQR